MSAAWGRSSSSVQKELPFEIPGFIQDATVVINHKEISVGPYTIYYTLDTVYQIL